MVRAVQISSMSLKTLFFSFSCTGVGNRVKIEEFIARDQSCKEFNIIAGVDPGINKLEH